MILEIGPRLEGHSFVPAPALADITGPARVVDGDTLPVRFDPNPAQI